MTNAARLICPFCDSVNPVQDECQACGGPLEAAGSRIVQEAVKEHEIPLAETEYFRDEPAGVDEVQELARTANQVGRTALGAYSLLWRTLAEAGAIALVGFVLGTLGGLTALRPWGILAGGLVGAAVGRSHKRTLGILLGAPAGALLGVLGGIVLMLIGLPPQALLVAAAAGALIGAPLGSRPYGMFRWWQKLRPWLGLFGGLAFGFLGMIIGWSLAQTVGLITF
jgi:hypothetical protein